MNIISIVSLLFLSLMLNTACAASPEIKREKTLSHAKASMTKEKYAKTSSIKNNKQKLSNNSKSKAIKDKSAKDKLSKGKSCKDKFNKYKLAKDKSSNAKSSKDKASKDKLSKSKSSKHKLAKNKSGKDKSSKDKASKDKSSKDKLSKSKSSKHKLAKDKSSNAKSSKDQASKDKLSKSKSSKLKLAKDKSGKDKASKDKASKDKLSKSKSSKHKLAKDKSGKDKASKDKASKDKLSKSKSSKLKLAKDKSGKDKSSKKNVPAPLSAQLSKKKPPRSLSIPIAEEKYPSLSPNTIIKEKDLQALNNEIIEKIHPELTKVDIIKENKETKLKSNSSENTYVSTLSATALWSRPGKTQTFFVQPEVEKTYQASQKNSLTAEGEFFFGIQRQLENPNLIGQLGLAYAFANKMALDGDIWEDADPDFNNYWYNYKISHQRLSLKGKLFLKFAESLQLYSAAAIGAAFNNANSFTIKPKIEEEVPHPFFQNYTASTFSYTFGTGFQKSLDPNWQLSLGYEFADWGKSQLARAPEQTLNQGLSLSHLYTHGLQLGLTYAFVDKNKKN